MIAYDLPLRIESTLNKREHWGKRAQRTKLHRFASIAVQPHPLPCVVRVVRIAPRKLDSHDNLRAGCKALVDGIAKRLGVDDADPRVRWEYDQERGRAKEYAVRIEIRGGA